VALLYGVAALEVALAVVDAARGEWAGAVLTLGVAVLTVVLARGLWRGFLRRGPDDWRYSWRALWRKVRS
jgi:hypothetical protein